MQRIPKLETPTQTISTRQLNTAVSKHLNEISGENGAQECNPNSNYWQKRTDTPPVPTAPNINNR